MKLNDRPASPFSPNIFTISGTPRSLLAALLSLSCVFSLGMDVSAIAAIPAAAKDKKPKQDASLKGLPITELNADEAVLHALNRLAYGPRPGDVERVRQMGLAKWIDEQLNPGGIDDKALEARLENYPTLKMSSAKLLEEYPQPKQAEKQTQKRAVAVVEPEQRREDAAAQTVARDMQAGQGSANASSETQDASQQIAESAASKQEMSEAPAPMKQDQPRGNPAANGGGKRDVLGGGDPNNVPRAIADDSKRPQRVVAELSMAKVTRAIYSERQLQQVMDDFWFNHFNVFAGKGDDRWLITSYEREVIQPHSFGKFKDLLTATAKSPAMLFYLDNYLSADPRAAQRAAAERAYRQQTRRGGFGGQRPANPQQNAQKKERGLNENYGRELMELHTLGVDGGYTQKDVTEVARCFTGWTIEKPRQTATFKFDERLHDPDPKVVMGKKIHAGGMKDGEQVIDLLAHHPSTAKFISTKLARRFVGDDPPKALIDRAAQRFMDTNGDLREVVRTILMSPEFFAPDAYRAKVKTPFEFLVSALRAANADVRGPAGLVRAMQQLGMPLFQAQPPTGYGDTADAWVNTGGLVSRMNFALSLVRNQVQGVRVTLPTEPLDAARDRLVQTVLQGQVSDATVDTLKKAKDVIQLTALALGAPEFQRR